tara:strand:+ start:2943 stop:3530 length:588 start_codon:yes stop_codon:yes gene_type:complete
MSFRKEEKIETTFYQQKLLLDKIIKLGGRLFYPPRKISSIYFDSKNFEMHNESEEGILPRKKIRIRYYNNDQENSNLEYKISSFEGKYKTTNKLNLRLLNRYLREGCVDQKYGFCYPIIKITYDRRYYTLNNVRITFDDNINYQIFNSKIKILDEVGVVELKSKTDKEIEDIDKILPLARKRFSKFSRAFSYLNI